MSNTPNAEPAARPHHQQTRTVATQRWVVFVVTGGNEGHHTHVVVLDDAGRHRPVLLAKTFDGFDAAWGFAQHIARLLDI